MEPFWVVRNEEAGPPRYKHNNPIDAKREADRLARANPGQRFTVLRSEGHAEQNDVAWTEHDEIPFF